MIASIHSPANNITSGFHTDALQNSPVEITDSPAVLESQFESNPNTDASRADFPSSASEAFFSVFTMSKRLETADKEKLKQFVELITQQDTDGDTQLHLLLWESHMYIDEILGQLAGAKYSGQLSKLVNIRNNLGQTVLIVAVLARADPWLVHLLVLLGADPDLCDNYSNNARFYANEELLSALEPSNSRMETF